MPYTNLPPIQVPAPEGTESGLITPLDQGYRGDESPISAPLQSFSDMDRVRFESGGFRRDFGYRVVGGAASSRVLGLIDHKFISDGLTFRRLTRLTNSGGKCKLEVYNQVTGEWVTDLVSNETIQDRLFSTVSMLGVLGVADGTQILIRDESTPVISASVDFPAGNALSTVGSSTTASLIQEERPVAGDAYTFHYDVALGNAAGGSGVSVKLGFYVNGSRVATRSYSASTGSINLINETQRVEDVRPEQELDFEIKIESMSASAQAVLKFLQRDDTSGGNFLSVAKGSDAEAVGAQYTFQFDIGGSSGGIKLKFGYFDLSKGSTEYVGEENFYSNGTSIKRSFTMPGLLSGDLLRIDGFFLSGDRHIEGSLNSVKWQDGAITVTVHGHSVAGGDTYGGVTYEVLGSTQGVFSVASPNSPAASFIAEFSDRMVALRDGGESQSFAWSVSGNPRIWPGDAGDEGSGQIFLLDAKSDPIDPLQSFVAIQDNLGAVFRSRSIMRAFPTGNTLQAIGVVPWIEEVGTQSPFSVVNTPLGALFLGHDMMVYLLTPGGLRRVGDPIRLELTRSLIANVDQVDATYDSVFHSYLLGVPEDGASEITILWILDLTSIEEGKSPVWRSRKVSATRLATVGKV